jgi:hypothetical protein
LSTPRCGRACEAAAFSELPWQILVSPGRALTTIALLAAVVTSTTAYADDITVEQSPFVSSRSWEEASAELKTPLSRGNPWSGA